MDKLSLALALWFAVALAAGVLLGCLLRKVGPLNDASPPCPPRRRAALWRTSYGPDDERREASPPDPS